MVILPDDAAEAGGWMYAVSSARPIVAFPRGATCSRSSIAGFETPSGEKKHNPLSTNSSMIMMQDC